MISVTAGCIRNGMDFHLISCPSTICPIKKCPKLARFCLGALFLLCVVTKKRCQCVSLFQFFLSPRSFNYCGTSFPHAGSLQSSVYMTPWGARHSRWPCGWGLVGLGLGYSLGPMGWAGVLPGPHVSPLLRCTLFNGTWVHRGQSTLQIRHEAWLLGAFGQYALSQRIQNAPLL